MFCKTLQFTITCYQLSFTFFRYNKYMVARDFYDVAKDFELWPRRHIVEYIKLNKFAFKVSFYLTVFEIFTKNLNFGL